MIQTKNTKKRGFTILETVVSIAIISLAITGVFSSVRNIMTSSYRVRDEVRAFYLAREAFDIIRNKRDSNQLARIVNGTNTHWLTGMSSVATDACYFGRICGVSTINRVVWYCGMNWGTCRNLTQDKVVYIYRHELPSVAYSSTIYKRELKFEQISANEIAVTVVVSWTRSGVDHEVTGKTIFFNWL